MNDIQEAAEKLIKEKQAKYAKNYLKEKTVVHFYLTKEQANKWKHPILSNPVLCKILLAKFYNGELDVKL